MKKDCESTEPRNVNDNIQKTRRHIKEAGRAERKRNNKTVIS